MAVAQSGESRFDFYWRQQGEWVEEPNQRRGGESGVQRLDDGNGKLLYAKRQVGHIYRSLLHPFGRPTVLRELDALNSFEQLGCVYRASSSVAPNVVPTSSGVRYW